MPLEGGYSDTIWFERGISSYYMPYKAVTVQYTCTVLYVWMRGVIGLILALFLIIGTRRTLVAVLVRNTFAERFFYSKIFWLPCQSSSVLAIMMDGKLGMSDIAIITNWCALILLCCRRVATLPWKTK
jgi:hypothetical protein